MQNVEFKAELRDLVVARQQCAVSGATFIATLEQTDTYFRIASGRLKRRTIPGEPTEWIFYHRPDRLRPTLSNFTILSESRARLRWGTENLREWLTVVKTRELWMLENIRIHLDEVRDLGTFIEFEAVVSRHDDVGLCHERVARLREAFAPILGEPLSVGYSDLLAAV